MENQIEPDLLKKLVELSTEIEKNFSTFRGIIGEEKVTNNEIKQILKKEMDSDIRRPGQSVSKIFILFQ